GAEGIVDPEYLGDEKILYSMESVIRNSPADCWRIGQFRISSGQRESATSCCRNRSIHDFEVQRNLRQLAGDLAGGEIVPNHNLLALLEQIPWYHNVVLVTKVKDPAQRLWYARKTIENGWSRAVLTVQIESDLYSR